MTPPVDDEYLLAALRIAAGTDPVPDDVTAGARAAFALRLPGGIAATPVRTGGGAGARSAGTEPSVHRFVTADLTIDIEPIVVAGRLEVTGQIAPAPGAGAWVEVRTPHVRAGRTPSEGGRFVVTGLPPGWVSVVCNRPGLAPVFTRWMHVRP